MPMPFMPYMPHRRPYTMFAPPCPCTPPGPPPEPHTPRPRAAPWGAVSIADALRGISSHLAELDETLAGMPKVITVNGAPLEPEEGVVALSLVDSAELDGGYLRFKAGDAVLFSVDASPFVKDGMVDAVGVADGNLVITFNTDSGKQPVSIPLTDIFDADDYYDKAAMDSLLSGKRDRTDLSVDQDKWLLVKPDGTLVWLAHVSPEEWAGGDGFELFVNKGGTWQLTVGGGSLSMETAASADAASLEFSGGSSVYRLVRGSRLALDTEIPPAQVVDSAVTRTSANPVKSSGIWSATWGALTVLPEGFASLYDWCVAQLAGKLALETEHYVVAELFETGGTGGGMGISAKHNNTYEDYLFTNGLPASPNDVVRRKGLPSNLPAAQGGTATSLVTTGDKYNWNAKADAADLRYRIAEALVRKTLPANCLPVTFTYEGVSYSINALVEESEASAVGDMYIMVMGTDYQLTMVESPATGGEPMSVIEVARFDAGGIFKTGLSGLQFGGVAPVADTSPTLADIQILADRTVNLITPYYTETSIDIELPAAVTVDGVRRARDFLLDVENGANANDLTLEFTALGVISDGGYCFVIDSDDSIGEMMTIGAGERVRLYFTETSFDSPPVPVFHVARVTLGDFVTSTTTQGGN